MLFKSKFLILLLIGSVNLSLYAQINSPHSLSTTSNNNELFSIAAYFQPPFLGNYSNFGRSIDIDDDFGASGENKVYVPKSRYRN